MEQTDPVELERHDRSLRAAVDELSNDSPSSTRLTPDSDSESDDGGPVVHAKGDEEYEMKEMDPKDRGQGEGPDWRLLADQHERGLEEAEEDDNRKFYTAAEEKKVIRKLDRRLVVFMALLYASRSPPQLQ